MRIKSPIEHHLLSLSLSLLSFARATDEGCPSLSLSLSRQGYGHISLSLSLFFHKHARTTSKPPRTMLPGCIQEILSSFCPLRKRLPKVCKDSRKCHLGAEYLSPKKVNLLNHNRSI